MKTTGVKYGGVTYNKLKKIYQVYFWNPLDQKSLISHRTENKEEAEEHLNILNFNFFSNNTQFLPKGISIDRREKKFVFSINIRNKTIYMFSSKDLNTVNNYKFEFIKQFFT